MEVLGMKYEIWVALVGGREVRAFASFNLQETVREMARRSQETPAREELSFVLLGGGDPVVRYENRGGKWVLE